MLQTERSASWRPSEKSWRSQRTQQPRAKRDYRWRETPSQHSTPNPPSQPMGGATHLCFGSAQPTFLRLQTCAHHARAWPHPFHPFAGWSQVLEAEAVEAQQEMDEFWEKDPKHARRSYEEAVAKLRETTRTDW
jgi:hypothetical protein